MEEKEPMTMRPATALSDSGKLASEAHHRGGADKAASLSEDILRTDAIYGTDQTNP